jgi:hypothetical protein
MKRIWANVEPSLAGIAAVLTILFAWHQCADVTSAAGRFVLVALLLLILGLLILIITREYRYARKSRYAEVVSSLNRIFFDIQAVARKTDVTSDEIRLTCISVVNTLASLLSLITATRCSVCIKVIEGRPGHRDSAIRYKVVAFCRDNISATRDSGQSVDHWIDQNTDFEDVLKAAGTPLACFFANYLPWMRGYKNSSFQVYGLPFDVPIPMLSDVVRNITWKLPYRSTIVAPITPSPQQATSSEHALSGYLCVDSRSLGAFRRRFDVDVVTGVANCLYDVVHRYCVQAWNTNEA